MEKKRYIDSDEKTLFQLIEEYTDKFFTRAHKEYEMFLAAQKENQTETQG